MKEFRLKFGDFIRLCVLFGLFISLGAGKRDSRSPLPIPIPLLSETEDSSEEEKEKDNDSSSGKNDSPSGRLELLSLPKNYNKLEIPISKDGYEVYVKVSLFVRSILEINEQSEELLLDVDLGLKWVDWKIYHHLVESGFKDPVTGKQKKNLTLDSEVLKDIWKPDVYIDEMASVDKTAILSKLITLKFLGDTDSGDSGDIVYSARNSLRLRCDMDFKYYPADTQTCTYHLRSYSYYESELQIYWAEPYGIFLDDPSDPNFDLQIESAEPNKLYKQFYIHEKFNKFRGGNYSALQFTIKARRKLSYHIVQTYLPSCLLIFITWLCFLLPANMVEARIGISMTTVLTLTAMFSAVRGQSPTVSYTMAIDIWMVFCIFFVFVALLLFTVIYWMKTRLLRHKEIELERLKLEKAKQAGEETGATTTEIDSLGEFSDLEEKRAYDTIVNVTKRYAFGTFSIIFILFIITYWTWLLLSSNYFDWDPSSEYNAISTEDHIDGDNDNVGDDAQLYLYRGIKKSAEDSEEDYSQLNETLRNLESAFDDLLNLFKSNDSNEIEETTTLDYLEINELVTELNMNDTEV